MSVEVSWSGLKKAAREGSWVFEVVPFKGETFDETAFDAAVKAANQIHQADIDRFCDGNMEWRFPTPTGIGFWCEYEMTGRQVTDFIGVLTAELEKQNVTATIRAVRQSQPKNLYENSDGMCLVMVLNGHRSVFQEGVLDFGWTAESHDLDAVVDCLLEWCAFEDAKYWIRHAQNSMQVEPGSVKELVHMYTRPVRELTSLIAETSDGRYRRMHVHPGGQLVVSLGSVAGSDWRVGLTALESIVRRLAPHIVWGGIARASTVALSYEHFMGYLWNHTKEFEEQPLHVLPWKLEARAELVLGFQVLGPLFEALPETPGWQVEYLDSGRTILRSSDLEPWFAQRADRELLREAFHQFPQITTQQDIES